MIGGAEGSEGYVPLISEDGKPTIDASKPLRPGTNATLREFVELYISEESDIAAYKLRRGSVVRILALPEFKKSVVRVRVISC